MPKHLQQQLKSSQKFANLLKVKGFKWHCFTTTALDVMFAPDYTELVHNSLSAAQPDDIW